MSLREENNQMSMLIPNLEQLVAEGHAYRAIIKLIDFNDLTRPLRKLYSELGRGGYPVSTGFKCLLVQFLEDLSDRELEAHLQDSLSAKLFCGFGLCDETPKHTYFSRLRTRIGTKRLSKLFKRIQISLKKAGYLREVFTFVDASKLESQIDIWSARDKAIADSENEEHASIGSQPQTISQNTGTTYYSGRGLTLQLRLLLANS
jgi:transposase